MTQISSSRLTLCVECSSARSACTRLKQKRDDLYNQLVSAARRAGEEAFDAERQTRRLFHGMAVRVTAMFASIQVLTLCLSANPVSITEFEGMGYLSILTNPQSSKPQVQEALKKLKEKSISPSVWIRILDDSRFSLWHRDRAFIELIQRHVQRQMTLGELRDLFRESKAMKKWPGCQLATNLYVLSVFDEEGSRAIYFVIERITIVDQLLAIISGKEVDESILEARILGVSLGQSDLLDK